MPLPQSKVIDLNDFESPDLLPYLWEINAEEAAGFGSSPDDVVPDSKQWECAMALRALDLAGAARSGTLIAGIGAGTEATIFALARRGALVFPVDRYLSRTEWSDVAPAGMLVNPARYSSLDVPVGHVIPVHSSALRLNLPSNAFDAVFSSGSIEHFGSLENVALAAGEIGRILKPGGVAAISTEYRVEGPHDRPWFDDNVILFTPDMLDRYIVAPSGLAMRAELDTTQSARTFESRQNLVDFLRRTLTVHNLEEKRAVYPNLILYHDGFLFCSVIVTLHKDAPTPDAQEGEVARHAVERTDADNAALATALERFQRDANASGAAHESHLLFGEVERLRAENDALRATYDRSNAWKKWTILRPARFVYRRIKRVRA